jgi:hypothetical protein
MDPPIDPALAASVGSQAAPELDDLLRQKRKTRPQKACQPCRIRKVKCSYETPCRTCVDRDHPELCSYERPAKRVNFGPGPTLSASHDSSPSARNGSELEQLRAEMALLRQSLSDMRQDIHSLVARPAGYLSEDARHGDRGEDSSDYEDRGKGSAPMQGLRLSSDVTGAPIYVGGNSIPAMVLALTAENPKDTVKLALGRSVLPLFGLENDSSIHPFVDLWGLPHGSLDRIEQLINLLPTDADCVRIFRSYRDSAHILFPAIVDIEQFEYDLTSFLTTRRNGSLKPRESEDVKQEVFGKDLHWLGLLFSALASGYQCCELASKERQLKSQVLGR